MDDFLRKAQSDWRGLSVDVAHLERRLRRHRWTPHLILAAEIAGGIVGFGIGLWFLSTALTGGGLLYAIAAIVMLTAMPFFTVLSFIARRKSLHWQDETPDEVLRASLARADASLRAIRVGYLGVAIIVGFVALLWIAQAIGIVRASGFVQVYSLTATGICVPYLVYLGLRQRQVSRERAACLKLMSEQPDASTIK
jgi:hypothetical protein